MEQESPFAYRPLDLSLREIRLVTLQPRSYDQEIEDSETDDRKSHIRCNITHSNFFDNPQYEALSYTWGPPEPTRRILIDGRPFSVRENLWSAFQHLRLEYKPRILWVDAICIDQINDEERDYQVSQMGEIYGEAERTIVWLGEYVSSLEWVFHPQTIPTTKEQIQKTKTFEALWVQAYWRRLWIVQEFLLAKDLIVQCGEHAIIWDMFLKRFQQCVNCDPDDSVSSSYLRPTSTPWWPRCVDQGSSLGMLVRQREENLRYAYGTKRLRKRPLVELLQLYEGARCHDARDKVFGLLGLSKPCCKSGIDVHYGASAIPLYHQILKHEVLHHGLCSEAALLDLSHGLRRILQIEDSPQRVVLFKPNPPLVKVRNYLSPVWCQGKILHVMEQSMGELTESLFLGEMLSLWAEYTDGVERHRLSEHIYRFSDPDQWVKRGESKADRLTRRLLRVFHAATSELLENDKYPTWAPELSTLKIFIGENGTAGLAPSNTMKGDLICETSDSSTSRILRASAADDTYDLIATAAHCDIAQPGDILKIPPPAKDPRLKVYFPLPGNFDLGPDYGDRTSLLEYFGNELDFVESRVKIEGWI